MNARHAVIACVVVTVVGELGGAACGGKVDTGGAGTSSGDDAGVMDATSASSMGASGGGSGSGAGPSSGSGSTGGAASGVGSSSSVGGSVGGSGSSSSGGSGVSASDAGATDSAVPYAAAGGPESVYAIDSTATLFSFDEVGNAGGSVALPTPIGNINGGGIAFAEGNLYVTIGQFTNAVRSYDLTLAPHTLPANAFAGLFVPRAIAYDPNDAEFYVGNGGSTVAVYDATGSTVAASGAFPGHCGPSGVAYDPDDHTIWVANYVGAPSSSPPMYGVAEYTESGATAMAFDYATQFAPPLAHENPYSIAVCPASATATSTLVVVGFIDDGSGMGTSAVQAYSTSGAAVGPLFAGAFTKPYALSCSGRGNVYVADVTGLYRDSIDGTDLGLPGPFAGMQPPIYGVLVAPGVPIALDAGARPPFDGGIDAAPGFVDGGETNGDDGAIDCGSAAVSFSADVMPTFQKGCTLSGVCHGQMNNATEESLYLGLNSGGGGSADSLAVYTGLVGVPSQEDPSMNLVSAGDTSNSYLWHKINGDQNALASQCSQATLICIDCTTSAPCGGLMPYQGEPLSVDAPQYLCTIENWISQGAPNN